MALHSSIDAETSPRTEPGVCSGLYHDVLNIGWVSCGYGRGRGSMHMCFPVSGFVIYTAV